MAKKKTKVQIRKEKTKIKRLFVTGLILGLIVLSAYAGKFLASIDMDSAYKKGLNDGSKATILKMVDLATECQIITISSDEIAKQLVDIECLNNLKK